MTEISEKELEKVCRNCASYPAGGAMCVVCNYEKGHPNFVGNVHYKQAERIKELKEACKDGLKELQRFMMRLNTTEADYAIQKLQRALKGDTNDSN